MRKVAKLNGSKPLTIRSVEDLPPQITGVYTGSYGYCRRCSCGLNGVDEIVAYETDDNAMIICDNCGSDTVKD